MDRRRAARGGEALAAAGLEPIVLEAKEGLSLVNGTQFMAAMGALGLVRARRLAERGGHRLRALARGAAGLPDELSPAGARAAPAARAEASAANVLALLEGSAIIESHRWCDKVQDAYSLRCAPQVHGAARDLLDYVDYTVSIELNAATDNPLVLVEDDMLVSNGNFHGQPLAFALDAMAMAVAELASISERRVERLVNPNLSDGLPPFLTVDGGLNSGFMIPQYVAASLVSENKVLAHPASVDSIPTSAGQEDHVSMGNASGLKAWQVLGERRARARDRAARRAQGVEFLAPLEPGRGSPRRRRSSVRCRRVSSRTGRLSVEIERSRPRSATARCSPRSRPRSERCGEAPTIELLEAAAAADAEHPYRDTVILYGSLAALVPRGRGADRRQHGQGRDLRRDRVRRRARLQLAGAGATGCANAARRSSRDGGGDRARRARRVALRRPVARSAPRAARS